MLKLTKTPRGGRSSREACFARTVVFLRTAVALLLIPHALWAQEAPAPSSTAPASDSAAPSSAAPSSEAPSSAAPSPEAPAPATTTPQPTPQQTPVESRPPRRRPASSDDDEDDEFDPFEGYPETLPYRPGPAPRSYVLEEKTRPALWIPGLAAFGGAYAGAILGAQPASNNGTATLYIPIVGPWITLGTCKDCVDPAYSAMVLDGVLQTAGVTLLILGLNWKRKVYVRTYEDFSFTVHPQSFGREGYGMGVSGTF